MWKLSKKKKIEIRLTVTYIEWQIERAKHEIITVLIQKNENNYCESISTRKNTTSPRHIFRTENQTQSECEQDEIKRLRRKPEMRKRLISTRSEFEWLWIPLDEAIGAIDRRKHAPFVGEWPPIVDCLVESTRKRSGRLLRMDSLSFSHGTHTLYLEP